MARNRKRQPAQGTSAITRDLIGERGEAIVKTRLMDFCGNPLPYFYPHFLGEKCPTFDYLVELVNTGSSPAYFLAQVKATRRGYTKKGLKLRARIKGTDVRRMALCPVPTYVLGVDETDEEVFIVSIFGNLTRAISSITTVYPLNCGTLKKLWDEVKDYWSRFDPSTKSSVFSM